MSAFLTNEDFDATKNNEVALKVISKAETHIFAMEKNLEMVKSELSAHKLSAEEELHGLERRFVGLKKSETLMSTILAKQKMELEAQSNLDESVSYL